MIKVVLYDIVWDTDGENVDLPTKVVIDDPSEEMIDAVKNGGDELSDYLSNVYGFCVYEFDARLSPMN